MSTSNSSQQPVIQILNQEENQPSMAILDNVLTETIGMALHNAVTAQHNAQMSNNATTTATVSRILNALHYPTAKKKSDDDGQGNKKNDDDCKKGSSGVPAVTWPAGGY